MNIYKSENICAHKGNNVELHALFNRAAKGEKLNIGLIGGSITQGTGASTHSNCYAYGVYEWWVKNYKNAEIGYINAGIGATDSKFAVARVEDDLLKFEPDFIIIEFAVNDVDNPDCLETAEGLIRRIRERRKDAAIVLLCNIIYSNGQTRQDEYLKLARAYGLSCISIVDTLYKAIQEGRLDVADVTADGIHPNDNGHRLIKEIICEYLQGEQEASVVGAAEPVSPITLNRYQNALIFNNKSEAFRCDGFIADQATKADIRDCFKEGFYASEEGASIELTAECRGFVIQYRKTVAGPAALAEVIIDGRKTMVLDGKFDEDWGDKLEIVTAAVWEERELHDIRLCISEPGEVPFYLVSIIIL